VIFPRVGVGVIIINMHGEILLGKRKNSHGSGEWAPAGGHLEVNESFEECAIREAFEETGLQLEQVKLLSVTNDLFKREGKHYVTIFMGTKLFKEATPVVKEPDKLEEWKWFNTDKLPENLFLSFRNFLNSHAALLDQL
jgi:8-oxo-dGTP diphosphatase